MVLDQPVSIGGLAVALTRDVRITVAYLPGSRCAASRSCPSLAPAMQAPPRDAARIGAGADRRHSRGPGASQETLGEMIAVREDSLRPRSNQQTQAVSLG